MKVPTLPDAGHITAVILSAGRSTRMGRFKPLMPLGNRRAIERVVDLFKAGGIGDLLVVVGHRAPEICRVIEPLKIGWVLNPRYRQGMFTSVLAGLQALPAKCHAFFIHPVDIPLVRPHTVQRLALAVREAQADVVYPTFGGRRGHPTLIRASLVPAIMQWSGAGGLEACLQRCEQTILELPVVDEGVLLDLDTPLDYDRMQARLVSEGLPSGRECRVLMKQMRILPSAIANHCRAVSCVALQLAQAVVLTGVRLDIELVRTAALLHDVARTRKDHADAGAHLLSNIGFDRLAPIVRVHMDLKVNRDRPVDEAQIVYLADKMVDGDQRVDMERRFSRQLERFRDNRDAMDAIVRRRENARYIRGKVERMTGRPIEAIVSHPVALPGKELPCSLP
jgi:putative nucleotidyltransferase with HDIG domain